METHLILIQRSINLRKMKRIFSEYNISIEIERLKELTWHKNTNCSPHSVHFNLSFDGIDTTSNHAGRPPTLLGKYVFTSSHGSHSSKKPKSTGFSLIVGVLIENKLHSSNQSHVLILILSDTLMVQTPPIDRFVKFFR